MKFIRFIIGKILLFFNALTLPKKIKRIEEEQNQVALELKKYSLYQFNSCPFCIKVRRTLHRLDLPMELRNAKEDPYKNELIHGGGRHKVPCLRIEEKEGEVSWMYESKDIVRYLDERFGP